MNRREFQKLAYARLDDARALVRAKRFDGAYYLAGYAVECALKACICKSIPRYAFPPSPRNIQRYYSHDLSKLLELAEDLNRHFGEELRRDKTLAEYWGVVKDWNEETRYQLRGREAAPAATYLLKAVADEEHGILKCLSKYW